jgi:thioredoxin reductase (NADPH)
MTDVQAVETDYDVIIIGGASAGLTAALYASRRTLKTLIITKALGGQLSMTPSIENYPGTKQANGMDLMFSFLEHAQEYGAEIAYETVTGISRTQDETFVIESTGGKRSATAVILAFGLTPKNLDVPGELEYQGKGVTYCATCDAPLFKNKSVAVVGGTYEALDAAQLLTRLNATVTLIHEKDNYPQQRDLFAEVQKNPGVTLQLNSTVKEIRGEQLVNAIVVEEKAEDGSVTEKVIEVAGVFVEKGHKIQSEWLGDLVEYGRGNTITVNDIKETKTPGLFAAGDVTPQRDKQVVVSAGAGAIAALTAYKYIQKKKGKPAVLVDWKHD